MPQKFTPDHLIALLYNETDRETTGKIFGALENDEVLSDDFLDYSELKDLLDCTGLDPHPTSVALIMEYSAKTQEVQHA